MNQEYKDTTHVFWGYFKNGVEGKISTSEGDNVTVNAVSLAAGGEKLYFATPEKSLQHIQLHNNPYVSLCAKHLSVTGKAKDLGPADQTANKEIWGLLSSTFPREFTADKKKDFALAQITPLTASLRKNAPREEWVIDFIHQTAQRIEPEL